MKSIAPSKPTCIDLFAGAGGLSIAAENSGAIIVGAIEGDRKAAQTYEFNFSKVPVAKTDLNTVKANEICRQLGYCRGSLDLLVAGPPCQGFSISNMRTRNDMNPDNSGWRVVLAFIHALRPRGIVLENVGGMETFAEGEVVTEILSTLNGIGYSARLYRLNAANHGVPQHRKRLFFAAVREGELPIAVRVPKASVTCVGDSLGDLPDVQNGNEVDALPYRTHGAALNAYQLRMRRNSGVVVRNCLASESTPLIVKRFSTVRQGGNWSDIPSRLFSNYAKPENCHRWLYRRLREDEPSVTISNYRKNMLIHPWQDRTLSVREAARLQAIPDHFVFHGNLQSQQQQVANAVPPPMGEAVIRTVLNVLKKAANGGRRR